MRTAVGGLLAGFISGATIVFLGVGTQPGQAQQGSGPAIPRTAAGKPDLNGLWQALNTANYDIQAHTARPAMAMRPGPVVPLPAKEVIALGAIGSVPAGVGIVVGDELPYLPAALEQKKKNQEGWLALDPEIKCYLPGVPRATYMPFPFQIFQSEQRVLHRLRIRQRRSQRLPERSRAAARGFLDGPVVGPVGGRHVRRRIERLQRSDVVRPRRQLPQRADDRGGALHHDGSRPHPVPRPR